MGKIVPSIVARDRATPLPVGPSRRILMLAPSHPSWDPRVVMRESRAHAERGHEVAVLAREDSGREFPEELELIPLPKSLPSRIGRIKQLGEVYRMARKWNPEIIQAHEVESCAVGLLLKWRTGAKLIFDVHECFQYNASYHYSGRTEKFIEFITMNLLRFLARRSDSIIVVSFTNEQFYSDYCGCDDVTIIHNSPEPYLNPVLEQAPEAAHTVVHLGHVPENRGLDKMMMAAQIIGKTHPIEMVFFGISREQEIEQFEKYVAEFGLEDSVRRVGWLPYDQISEALNVGGIGILALQPGGNPLKTLHNKLFTYMTAGQAVLGPANSDTERILDTYECGVGLDMSDPNEIARGIIELIDEPERRVQMGKNGRAAVENDFGWHHMRDDLERVIQSL